MATTGYHDGMTDLEYFEWQLEDSKEFWRRLGGMPDLTGRSVLELGCGHGALCILAAQAGARQVVGLDLDEYRVEFAVRNLHERYPELSDRVDLRYQDVQTLVDVGQFDVVVSKDTLEHVIDLDHTLAVLYDRAVAGGVFYAGFSPLYFSPWGDHGRAELGRLPWAHALLGERRVVSRLRRRGKDVQSLADLGLNGCTDRDFLDAFERSPFVVEDLKVNQGDKTLLKAFSWIRERVPSVSPLVTVSIYARLRRPVEPTASGT